MKGSSNTKTDLSDIPNVILVIGTDASGKDHVANLLARMIQESGGEVEKRKRFFSGCVTTEETSEGKGWFDSLQERLFLALYPYLGSLLVKLLEVVTRRDLESFSGTDKKLLIIGHNGIRGLAFYLGNVFNDPKDMVLPDSFRQLFSEIQTKTGVHTIVLDVDDRVRKSRIKQRIEAGTEDNFDRYMAKDGVRSERIEACLVQVVEKYMGGSLIENNDLPENVLREKLLQGFQMRAGEISLPP